MPIIPPHSGQKIALLCAEANALRNQVAGLGSSVVKFDNAIVNAIDVAVDVCNQFDRGVKLAKDAGELILDVVNGVTTSAGSASSIINEGFTKLPSLPLPVGAEINDILDSVKNTQFEQINSDMVFSQLCQFAPDGFNDLLKTLNRIPDDLKTPDDFAVDKLAKSINFSSVLSSTESAIQRKSVTCIMSGSKERLAEANTLMSQQTESILSDVIGNTQSVNPISDSFVPFEPSEIPGLNLNSTNILTLAGNLTGVSSAIFYVELACQIARVADSAIDTVNKLIDRYQNVMPSDEQLNARLDKKVRGSLNTWLKQVSGLSIDELEQLKEECGAFLGS